jgi:hypothetical protein
VVPGRYTVTLAARGMRVSQPVEVLADTRLEIADGALAARATASARLAALQHSFNDGVELHRRMAVERERLETALSGNVARRDSLAALREEVKQRLEALGRRFGAGFGGPKFGFLDLDGAMQASSTGPTVAQERTLAQLGARLRTDLAALNALLSGSFTTLQQKAERAGVVLAPVPLP